MPRRILALAGIAAISFAGATAGAAVAAPAAMIEEVAPGPARTTASPTPAVAPPAASAPAATTAAAAPAPVPAVTTSAAPLATPVALSGPTSALACVAPTDAAAIDAVLTAAGSPLAGEGATFVAAGTEVDLDPRALVAIAAHETILATYGPSQSIHNPFGLGPGMSFAGYAEAIRFAATTLRGGYLDEGRLTLGPIGSKWAPVGAANDPGGLNRSWVEGVGRYYATLGGDPEREVLLSVQGAGDTCDGTAPAAPLTGTPATPADDAAATPAEPTGPPVVTAWDGTAPRTGAGPAGGADAEGTPATIDGFVFPVALPVGTALTYRDTFRDPGGPGCLGRAWRCSVTLAPPTGTVVVASAAGRLESATAAEAESGITFWITTAGGDRIGYGALAAYAQGIGPGTVVAAGQPIGASGAQVTLAWEHEGERINPHALLSATRPSS